MATRLIDYINRIALSRLESRSADESVLYIQQDLTAEQKAQARANIGVASADDVVYLGSIVGTA